MTDQSMWQTGHLGRSFHGTPLEDECPCPKAPCGLVIASQRDPSCQQHHPSKTIRQGHPADQCPGQRAPLKAYCVPLKGLVVREFLVYATSAAEAREKMRGDRAGCEPMDDHFEETGLGKITRMPTEDKYV